MLQPRYFNNIERISPHTIRKSSIDATKMCAEYNWFKNNRYYNAPKAANLVIDNDVASYDMEYIEGKTLAEYYVSESLPLDVFGRIFQYIAQKVKMCRLDRAHNIQRSMVPLVRDMYSKKTLDRLGSESYKGMLDTRFVFNGWEAPLLRDIISDCSVSVSLSDLCFSHGDLCFSNIILKDGFDAVPDEMEKYLYFVDPRGLLSNGEMSPIGDYRYDIGKLGHSVVGLYDLIKQDMVSVRRRENELEYSVDCSDYKMDLQNLFFAAFGKERIWYDIMVHLFLSMIPLHADNPKHQDAMLATALKLYKEGKEL